MAFAIDITDGRGLNKQSVSLVTVEEEQGDAVFAVHSAVKALLPAVHYYQYKALQF